MKIDTSWNKVARPEKPSAGKKLRDRGVVEVKWGKRGKKGTPGEGYAVRFCSGTKCDSSPKSKARVATPQDSGVTTSAFERYKKTSEGKKEGDLTAGVMKGICKGAGPGLCRAQVGYRDGRRVMRFCTGEGKPGHVVDIHGKSPAEVRDLTLKACAGFRKTGKYPGKISVTSRGKSEEVEVGDAALGGTRKRRSVRRAIPKRRRTRA